MEKVVKGMENLVTTVESKSISLELANKMIEAAVVKGEELGMPFSITIVDKPGNLRAFAAMDGALPLSLEVAQNKAFSAAVITEQRMNGMTELRMIRHCFMVLSIRKDWSSLAEAIQLK